MQNLYSSSASSDAFYKAMDYFYADKTMLIKALLDSGAKNFLFAAPPAFGKTLAISMIRSFFEKKEQNNTDVFRKMDIGRYGGEKYLAESNKYPVIHLDLLPVKNCISPEETAACLKKMIYDEIKKCMPESDLKDITLKNAIPSLAETLYKKYSVKPLFLADNYDAPLINKGTLLHSALADESEKQSSSAAEVISFLSAALNDENIKFSIFAGRLILTGYFPAGSLDPETFRFLTLSEPGFGPAFGFGKRELKKLSETFSVPVSGKETNAMPELTELYRHSEEAYGMDKNHENGYVNPGELLSWMDSGFESIPREWSMAESEAMAKFIFKYPLKERAKLYALIMGKKIALPDSKTFGNAEQANREKLIPILLATGYLRSNNINSLDSNQIELAMPRRHTHFFTMLLYHKQIAKSNPERLLFNELYKAIIARDALKTELILTSIYNSNNGKGLAPDRRGEFAEILFLGMAVQAGKKYMLREPLPEEGGRSGASVSDSWPEAVLEPENCTEDTPLIALSISEIKGDSASIAAKNLERLKGMSFDQKYAFRLFAGITVGETGCKASIFKGAY